MSMEMWFIYNCDNALLQNNKTAEISFVRQSPNYITINMKESWEK